MAFPGRRKAVFVHGCFWHQHSIERCPIQVVPSSNRDYWDPKLVRNKARDVANIEALKHLGWKSLVVWECEIRGSTERVCAKVARFLGPPKAGSS